jgi:hypothetical protein
MEMHLLPVEKVREVVQAAGGEIVHVTEDWTGGDYARSVLYVARKPDTESGSASG